MAKKSSDRKEQAARKADQAVCGTARKLKAIANDKTTPMEEPLRAALKLAELPRTLRRRGFTIAASSPAVPRPTTGKLR